MVYKKFQDLKLSAPGKGTMRLPVMDGDDNKTDEAEEEKMTACAMEQGINYFDTAWGCHGGNSELVMGKILEKYLREQFYYSFHNVCEIYTDAYLDEKYGIFTYLLEQKKKGRIRHLEGRY